VVCIDLHAHYFPTEYLDTLDRFGSETTAICRDCQAGENPAELAARFGMMDAAGVDVQVVSAAAAPPYFEDEADAVAAARLGNDLYADLVTAHRPRLLAFAVTPLPHVAASIDEVRRALDDLGMAGVAVASSVLGRSLADPEFEPFYAELDRREATLLVHPAGMGAGSPLITGYDLTWMLGAPVEDTLAVLHLILSGIASRYRRIRYVACHLGGALPLLLPRLDRLSRWEAPHMPELPSVAARRFWYETTAHGHVPALRAAVETLGADRLVLGSDYPYQRDEWYSRAVSYVRDTGLAAQDVAAILGGNAAPLVVAPRSRPELM
jgi:aminocarboxymuconate-semialdehyde decarboxylase